MAADDETTIAPTMGSLSDDRPPASLTAETPPSSQPDDSLLGLLPSPRARARESAPDGNPLPDSESSLVEPAVMDRSRDADESLTEEAVREHLKDVESSFLPNLSPLQPPPAESSPQRRPDVQPPLASPEPPPPQARRADTESLTPSAPDFSHGLDHLDSSPSSSPSAAAAAARAAARAANLGSGSGSALFHNLSLPPALEDDLAAPPLSHSDKTDAASNSGQYLRVSRRPNSLRDRKDSRQSSTSSYVTSPESHVSSDRGLDPALPIVAASAFPPTENNFSRPASASISSNASAFVPDDPESLAPRQLEPLTEVDSPTRPSDGNDALATPKPSRERLGAAPTDTVIARHVSNVQVPESLAREYRFKNGLQTPRKPPNLLLGASLTGRGPKSLTLKEQSNTIERLSKENFDLKLKVMFLSDRLDKLSEEGIKEMISENVDLKTSLAVLQRDNKMLRKRVKELEKQAEHEHESRRPDTARSTASSVDPSARLDDEEREEELLYLRERVEEYVSEIERLRSESVSRESDRRRLADMVKTLGERSGEQLGRQDEVDVWKDLLEQETARREQADDENRKLRDELFRLKKEMPTGQSALHHTTNIYNISKKQRDSATSSSLPPPGTLGEAEASNTDSSATTTLVEELRRESDQLRHENAELRREVGAQTSMLTSRNREKERLYQEIEDLKMAQRRGDRAASSSADGLLERSASRIGQHARSQSRGSATGKSRRQRTDQSSESEQQQQQQQQQQRQAQLQQRQQDEENERDGLENRLAELRDRLSEVKLQNQELQRELEACMEDFETAIGGKRQAEENALALQEELEAALNDLVVLQSERDEALQEQGEMEGEFEALRREAQDEIDTLEAEADQRNEEIQRMQAELRDRTESFEALQEEMRKMSEALVRLEDEQDGKLRRIGQIEGELESSNRELEELEQKLSEVNDKNQRLSVQQESSQGEIAFLREEQEADKVRIGDLEAALASAQQSLREEKDRAKELDGRLQQERVQREMVADREKEEVQQFVNQLNREASSAKDEVRRLRKSLSSREVEATEWKERLLELENNLREALGDLNGTRSSLLKSVAKMQRELENTVRELDATRASLMEKERIVKQRDALLESHALESRKVAELLDRERVAHRNAKSQLETFQKSQKHLSLTASSQDARIAELENKGGQERKKLAVLEQTLRTQLAERNELLLTLWKRLSALCGREWVNGNALVDRQVVPSVEVIANRLPGFTKNLVAAVKTIETMVGSFESRVKLVERDLQRDYQTLEDNLEVRVKKLDRLEAMVRNSAASGPREMQMRMQKLEEAYRQLKVEHATVKAAQDARHRAAQMNAAEGGLLSPGGGAAGSPSPSVPRGPGDRDRSRSVRSQRDRWSQMSGAGAGPVRRPSGARGTGMDMSLAAGASTGAKQKESDEEAEEAAEDGERNEMKSMKSRQEVVAGGSSNSSHSNSNSNNDNRWLLRLRDMEYKLKLEREGRNQDRQSARQRLGGLEMENRDLRERIRRTTSEADE